MGEYLQQMFGIFVITLFLMVRFCECFPQINDNNKIVVSNQNLESMFHEQKSIGNAKSASVEVKDDYPENDSYRDDRNIPISQNFNFKSTGEILRKIKAYTETSIVNIMKNYFTNLKTTAKTIVAKSDVNKSKGNNSHVIKTNMTTTAASVTAMAVQQPSSVVINNKNGPIMPLIGLKTQTIKMPAPAKSRIDRWLPGLRSYRRKRSFYADLGLDYESAFSDEPVDIVYGAHTSPCDYSDRHYCLNGGTCVFVGALEIKTCRCKIGYQGLRCEALNQEFLIALLTQGFYF